ncbi:unnamed protein product [Closterium sp. NIES-53]
MAASRGAAALAAFSALAAFAAAGVADASSLPLHSAPPFTPSSASASAAVPALPTPPPPTPTPLRPPFTPDLSASRPPPRPAVPLVAL